jgi:hypothetical protein
MTREYQPTIESQRAAVREGRAEFTIPELIRQEDYVAFGKKMMSENGAEFTHSVGVLLKNKGIERNRLISLLNVVESMDESKWREMPDILKKNEENAEYVPALLSFITWLAIEVQYKLADNDLSLIFGCIMYLITDLLQRNIDTTSSVRQYRDRIETLRCVLQQTDTSDNA